MKSELQALVRVRHWPWLLLHDVSRQRADSFFANTLRTILHRSRDVYLPSTLQRSYNRLLWCGRIHTVQGYEHYAGVICLRAEVVDDLSLRTHTYKPVVARRENPSAG